MNDQAANIKFVQEVEKHPELYNYNLPGYSRRAVTDKAWIDMANEVSMTVAECKEKWRNLRTVFARKMKLPPSGSGAKKRKAYYLADVMQFALPFIKTYAPPSCGNLPEVPEKETFQATSQDASEALPEGDDRDDHDKNNPSEIRSVLTQALPCHIPSSPIPPVKPSTSTSIPIHTEYRNTDKNDSSPQIYKKMTPKQRAELESDKAVTAYFNEKRSKLDAISTQRSSEDERKDALRMFLLSLMPELLQLSEVHLKLFKRRVFGFIDDIASMETSCIVPVPMMSPYAQPSQASMSSSSPSLVQVQ